MIPTFDRQTYAHLLIEYLPMPIESEESNDEAIELAEYFSNKGDLTPEEEKFLGLLVTLIEDFEERAYGISQVDSSAEAMLEFLMDQRDLTPADLVRLGVGSEHEVVEILNGSRSLELSQIDQLAQIFQVDKGLFSG